MAKSLLQLARINYNKGDYQQAEDNYLVYRKVARQNPASLLFGIKVADKSGNSDAAASYKLLLQSKYPDSEEAKQVRQGSYQ